MRIIRGVASRLGAVNGFGSGIRRTVVHSGFYYRLRYALFATPSVNEVYVNNNIDCDGIRLKFRSTFSWVLLELIVNISFTASPTMSDVVVEPAQEPPDVTDVGSHGLEGVSDAHTAAWTLRSRAQICHRRCRRLLNALHQGKTR